MYYELGTMVVVMKNASPFVNHEKGIFIPSIDVVGEIVTIHPSILSYTVRLSNYFTLVFSEDDIYGLPGWMSDKRYSFHKMLGSIDHPFYYVKEFEDFINRAEKQLSVYYHQVDMFEYKEDIIREAKYYKHYLYKWSVYLKGQTTLTRGPFLIEEIKMEWLDIPKTSYDMRYILRHKYDNKCTISVREGDIVTRPLEQCLNEVHDDMINSMLCSVPTFYMTKEEINAMFEVPKFQYKKIIFSGPCTIILWKDGTKTIAKTSDRDTFDPEKGVAICFMKRALGETEGKKVLRKANKDYYDEIARVANKQLNEELKKSVKTTEEYFGTNRVVMKPWDFGEPMDNNKVIKVAKEEQDDN